MMPSLLDDTYARCFGLKIDALDAPDSIPAGSVAQGLAIPQATLIPRLSRRDDYFLTHRSEFPSKYKELQTLFEAWQRE
jgi:hypothetical protein